MSTVNSWRAGVAVIIAAVLLAVGINFGLAQSIPRVVTATPGGHIGGVGEPECVLSGSGYCTITHNLGARPAGVVVTPDNEGQLGTTDQFTATTFRARWGWYERINGSNRIAAGTRIKFSWVPAGVPDAPPPSTTSPTTSTPPTTPPPTSPPTTPPPTSPTVDPAACTTPYYTSSARDYNGAGGTMNGGFHIRNNVWNAVSPWSQTINVCSYKSWYVTANHPGAGADDSVKSYPGSQKNLTGAEIPLSTMGNITSTFNVKVPAGGGTIPGHGAPNGRQWNAAYDLWLNCLGCVEVMVWNNWAANWRYWYDTYGGEQVTIDGVSYSAYHRTGVSGNDRAMWFVRNNVTNVGTQDLDGVLRWAVTKGWLTNSDRIAGVEYGFEIFYTGGSTDRFDMLDYSLTIG